MGTNVHAFAHRLTALSMACLASAGMIFCVLSGLGCSFIEIEAFKGRSIGNANGDVYENMETAYLGVQCLSGSDVSFYDVDGSVDRLWNLSRIFLYIGLTLGAATTLFAWLLSSCVRPTAPRWQILSIFAACSAVFQIPIFLVYESDNCNFDVTRQTCYLSTGAYLNVVSISIWIIMTIWVQCLRAPRWDEELDAWRVTGSRGSSSLSGLAIGFERKPANSMHPEEKQGGVGGDETVETTTDVANSPSRTQEEADLTDGKNEDIENQLNRERRTPEQPNDTAEILEDEYSVDGSNAAASKTVRQKESNDKSSFTIGQCVRNRSKESTSATKTMKRNLRNTSLKGQILAFDKNNSYELSDQAINEDDKHPDTVAQTTSKTQNGEVGKTSSFMKSMRNKLPRVQIKSSGKNKSQRQSSLVSDLMCSSQPIHHEPPIATTTYTDTDCDLPTVDKSVAADTGKHAVDLSQAPTNDPGFHISCVFPDGSKQEAHFPSMSNCCIGMGDPEEEEETKFQRFPQVSKDFQMVGFDDNDDYEIKNSRSADFLVRKLRKEEEVAAARRAKRNMAPVAAFEFVRSDIPAPGDRRKNGNGGQSDAVINDDVSEMTRGSGWASGVSEILDDTDLRHQPKAILDGISQKY